MIKPGLFLRRGKARRQAPARGRGPGKKHLAARKSPQTGAGAGNQGKQGRSREV